MKTRVRKLFINLTEKDSIKLSYCCTDNMMKLLKKHNLLFHININSPPNVNANVDTNIIVSLDVSAYREMLYTKSQ